MNYAKQTARRIWPYPIIIIVVICCICICCYCCYWRCCCFCDEQITTVFVIRHAEKDAGSDPPLTPAGQQRAEELVHVAGQAGVEAVFSTQTLRTMQTAQPLADHLGIAVTAYSDHAALASTIKSSHAGEVVFVVGHSNTVPDIIEALGGETVPDLMEYDNLFAVTLCGSDDVEVVHMEYGTLSP